MMKTTLLALASLSMAAACAKEPQQAQAADPTQAVAATNPNQPVDPAANYPPTTPPLDAGDMMFLTKAAQGGMVETELGTRAAELGSSDEVKMFGQRMQADHGRASAELKDVARRKGVVLPTQLDSDEAQQIDDLTMRRGTDFDQHFAKTMVDDHEETVSAFEKASRDLKDPELRAWAASKLPTLRMHLHMAEEMKSKVSR
jgi:putative membrane protein